MRLADESELVFAFFDKANLSDGLVFGRFGSIYGDGITGDKLASFAFTRSEVGLDEDVDELSVDFGGREALSEKVEIRFVKVGNLAVAKEERSDFFGLPSSIFAVDDFGGFLGEASLAEAGGRVFVVLGENLFKFVWHDEGEVLEVILKSVIGLVEPELVKVENRGFFGVEPNGVTFGFAKFATSYLVDNEWARVAVSFGAFEAFDEMNARGAVAKLISAAELEINIMGAEKVEEIVALDEGVAKFGIGDAGAAFADAFLDKLAVKKLGHTESFADFAEERKELDIFEPIVIVKDNGIGRGVGDPDDLFGESGLVAFDFVEVFKVAFGGIFGVANLAGGTTNEIVRSITVTDEACAHHEGGEMADMKRIGAWVGAPIEIMRSFV